MSERWERTFVLALVVVSVGLLLVEVDIDHAASDQRVPGWMWYAEIVVALLLTADGVRNVLKARRAGTPVWTPEFVFDVLAVLPFFVGLALPASLYGLARALRVLRLLKLYRYSPTAHVLMGRLLQTRSQLAVLAAFTTITALVGAVAVFEMEHAAQPEAFSSIGNSLWWMIVTMTTVGYGDISPVTPEGKFIAVLIMPFTLAIMGALIGIVGGAFQSAIEDTANSADRG